MQSLRIALTLFAVCLGSATSTFRPLLNARASEHVFSPMHEFHYQADIRHNGRHVCSGAILGQYDVVTAAHCIQNLNAEELTVAVGNRLMQGSHSNHDVAKVQLHPLFDPASLENDVALVKVKKPFRFGRYVDRVSIPDSGEDLQPGEGALVSGWIHESDAEEGFFKAAKVEIIPREECNQTYGSPKGVGDRMLCSGLAPDASMQTGCLADPGAPLVSGDKLFGIASWGAACIPGSPNHVVYTSTSKMDYFLKKNTFIYEKAKMDICAALQLVISLLPLIPVLPAWVVSAFNLLLSLLC